MIQKPRGHPRERPILHLLTPKSLELLYSAFPFHFLAVFRYLHSFIQKSIVYSIAWSLAHSNFHTIHAIIAAMKSALTAGLLASGWLLQQAVATGWGDSPSFSSVSNTDNNCTTDQKNGFDWSGLPTGGFNSFGGFGFNGFSCQDSFKPNSKKRSSLKVRDDFQVSKQSIKQSKFMY